VATLDASALAADGALARIGGMMTGAEAAV
jgi:hypothetical protein